MHIDRYEQDGEIVLNLVIEGSDCPPVTQSGSGKTIEQAMSKLAANNPKILQVKYRRRHHMTEVTVSCRDDRNGNVPFKVSGVNKRAALKAVYGELHTATFPYQRRAA